MEINKQQVVDLIRSKAGEEIAQKAEKELPDKVDPAQHADLLSKHGIDPQELLGKAGGAGGLGGLLG